MNNQIRLNARELRDLQAEDAEAQNRLASLKRRPLWLILENIYDTYNIGGLFRLADALAVEKIYLCGEMETPPNHKIKKASIGTYKIVPWEYKSTAREAIEELRETYNVKRETLRQGAEKSSSDRSLHATRSPLRVYAVEQDTRSISFTQADYKLPLALVLGNETSGVTCETLDLCDKIVEIPMYGINKSLNVIVSAAIVSYWAISK